MTRHVQMKAVDDKFFTRSKSGAIWGRVYFEIGNEAFPDSGWTDLVTSFSQAWLEALTRIASGAETKERAWFMDGPFAVDIFANGGDLLKLTFLHREAAKQSAEADVGDLLENAITVSKQVLGSCKKRGWADRDVSNLEEAIQRGVKVLLGLKGPG